MKDIIDLSIPVFVDDGAALRVEGLLQFLENRQKELDAHDAFLRVIDVNTKRIFLIKEITQEDIK